MTPLILSHETAVAYWNSPWVVHTEEMLAVPQAELILRESAGTLDSRSVEASAKEEPLRQLSLPFDLLSSARGDRRKTETMQVRSMQAALPANSLMSITISSDTAPAGVELYVATPELAFVQMAQHLDRAELVKLGFELCGMYANEPRAKKGYVSRPPVTTPERLHAYAESALGQHGAKAARTISKYLIAHSKTPDETCMAMLACLPRSLGGIGVPAAQMSQAIELPEDVTRMIGTKTLTPTLYWEDIRTALEFDARSWEDESARDAYNRRKENVYRHIGIDIISVNINDIQNLERMRRILESVASKLGKRRLPANENQALKQQQLHESLMKDF